MAQPDKSSGTSEELLDITGPAEQYLSALEMAMGGRLRKEATFWHRVALAAGKERTGFVMVVWMPPGDSQPMEVRTYPWGTQVVAHNDDVVAP